MSQPSFCGDPAPCGCTILPTPNVPQTSVRPRNGVQAEVEAALLNSEGDPKQEVLAALQGIVRFAKLECEATDQGLRDLLEKALKVEIEPT